MLIPYHRTSVMLDHPESYWEYDETLQDKVWKQIIFHFITTDISMRRDYDPEVKRKIYFKLPPPDPNNFVPFDKVTTFTVLGWINEHVPEIYTYQVQDMHRLLAQLGEE